MATVLRIDKAVWSEDRVIEAIETGNCYSDSGVLTYGGDTIAYVTSNEDGNVSGYKTQSKSTATSTTPGKSMDKVKEVAVAAFELNKDAAINSAKLEGGRLALNQIMKAYVKLPWGFGKLKKSPLVRLGVANVANAIVKNFIKRENVVQGSEYMVKAAMDDAVKQLDLVNKIEGILEKNIGKYFSKQG